MDFRVVVSDPRSGLAYQLELKEPGAGRLLGRRIGDRIEGDLLGLPGYTLQITGGSDRDGFPMRADLPGTGRKRVLVSSGPGYHPAARGVRRRKSLHGREISTDIAQINVKILEAGTKPLEEILGRQKEEKR
ncbi:MAG: 30S ribosomal protein S6e [Methanothrix sp.]|nr:30S ribosomal protein S6e [Methanothrix sp.]